MFKLDLDDLPVPAILVDLSPLQGMRGKIVSEDVPPGSRPHRHALTVLACGAQSSLGTAVR